MMRTTTAFLAVAIFLGTFCYFLFYSCENQETLDVQIKASGITREEEKIISDAIFEQEKVEDFQLKKWDRSKSIGFLHCGKCGGTSMDRTLGPVVRKLSTREDDKYIGNLHYDWSFFELFEKDSVEPIILLRDPVERSVSNYHFKKTIPAVAKSKQPTYVKFMKSTFDTFLEQPEVMVDFAHLWIDSFAGLSMIDGLMSDDYYGKGFLTLVFLP